MPRVSPNPTVGKSGKHLISPAISVFRVLLCLALSGCSTNDETVTPSDSVEFVFPLEAGTMWNYAYSLSFRHYPDYFDTRGHQVWRSAGPGSPNSVTILVTRIDTTTTYPWYVGGDTTTVIAQMDNSFSIIVTSDSLYIQWYQFAFRPGSRMAGLFTIPRIVEQSTNTLTLQLGTLTATYVSGKGLTFWNNYNNTMFYWDERLTLESMSP
jgi:hypothetical protein